MGRPQSITITPSTRFGRLLVIKETRAATGIRGCLCRCDCGADVITSLYDLIDGKIISCGCRKTEKTFFDRTTHGCTRTSSETKEYRAWSSMNQRCLNPSHRAWKRYGGRGIKISDRWRSFEKFFNDMGKAPAGTSLDRINNDGDYAPGNCRWADCHTQQNNRRSNVRITIGSESRTIAEWCRHFGLHHDTVARRIRLGWAKERLFSPVRSPPPA